MSQARTKLDILYDDVLGDIKTIIDRVEKLDQSILESKDQALSEIDKKIGTLVLASKNFDAVAKNIALESSISVQKQINTAAVLAAQKAFDTAISENAKEHINNINSLSKKIDENYKSNKKNYWLDLSVSMICSILSTLAVVWTLLLTGSIRGPAGEHELQQMNDAKFIQNAWKNLTPQVQEIVKKAAQK